MKTIWYTFITALLITAAPAMAQQLPNGDFEQRNDSLPAGWAFETYAGGLDSSYVHSGQYAMAVWNWYYYAEGIAVNGNTIGNNFMEMEGTGTPATEKAAYLNGFYLYDTTNTDTNEDTALVSVTFRKKIPGGYDTVAYGVAYLLPTPLGSSNMVPFTVQINDLQPGVEPDTVVVMLQSSLNGFCDMSTSGNCLYLYVDKLSFSDTISTTGINEVPRAGLKLFPNPAQNTVTVSVPFDNGVLNVLDISGRKLQTFNAIRGDNVIDVSAYPQGLYMIELVQNGAVLNREKLMKQ